MRYPNKPEKLAQKLVRRPGCWEWTAVVGWLGSKKIECMVVASRPLAQSWVCCFAGLRCKPLSARTWCVYIYIYCI